MPDTRPLLLIDVDGPLNPYAAFEIRNADRLGRIREHSGQDMTPPTSDTGPTAADDELATRAMAACHDPFLHVIAKAMGSAHQVSSQLGRIVQQLKRRRGL